jgi:hypothetical protein
MAMNACVLIVNLVDRADIRMIQRRRSLRFALEAGERLLIFSNFVRKELQGHKAMQLHVLGFVDDTHPPAAEFFDDVIVGDGLVDHEWRGNSACQS